MNACVNAWDWTPRFTEALRARATAPNVVSHVLGVSYDTARRLLGGGKPESDTLMQALMKFGPEFANELCGHQLTAKELEALGTLRMLARAISEEERRAQDS